jgi:hypothetical protein
MPTTTTWVLEVIRFITERDGADGWMVKGGKYEHIGYMKAKFRTKNDACAYYDRHNPHMRSLNARGTWKSDWDPNTHLLYIVRKDYWVIDTIAPFSENDLHVDTISNADNSAGTIYKYLK